MRQGIVVVALVASVGMGTVAPAQTPFPGTLSQPDAVGDQAIFYFDARASYTTFLTLRSIATQPLTVRLLFYTGDFASPLVRDVSLGPQSLRVVDVGGLRADGLPQLPGVAIATAVDGSGGPFVTHAIGGNFTVANIATGSGWGAPAAARSALRSSDLTTAQVGSTIDGTAVFLPPIAPTSADLAAYYDPNDLAPVALGGNEIVFVTFLDRNGPGYSASSATTAWEAKAMRNDGSSISANTFSATGVVVTDLASVAGTGANGASGWILFRTTPATTATTRLVFFTEALGTFGTGYLLPPIGSLVPCCPSS
jgi:hypothetical protein